MKTKTKHEDDNDSNDGCNNSNNDNHEEEGAKNLFLSLRVSKGYRIAIFYVRRSKQQNKQKTKENCKEGGVQLK